MATIIIAKLLFRSEDFGDRQHRRRRRRLLRSCLRDYWSMIRSRERGSASRPLPIRVHADSQREIAKAETVIRRGGRNRRDKRAISRADPRLRSSIGICHLICDLNSIKIAVPRRDIRHGQPYPRSRHCSNGSRSRATRRAAR